MIHTKTFKYLSINLKKETSGTKPDQNVLQEMCILETSSLKPTEKNIFEKLKELSSTNDSHL